MTNPLRSLVVLLLAGLLGGACARTPAPRSETPVRIKDSVPEKIAAQRAATPGLALEHDDERWGFEAARERRRQADARKPPASADPTSTTVVPLK